MFDCVAEAFFFFFKSTLRMYYFYNSTVSIFRSEILKIYETFTQVQIWKFSSLPFSIHIQIKILLFNLINSKKFKFSVRTCGVVISLYFIFKILCVLNKIWFAYITGFVRCAWLSSSRKCCSLSIQNKFTTLVTFIIICIELYKNNEAQ